MKKIILLLLVVPFLLNGQAQNESTHYYYFNGEKVYLELNTKSMYIKPFSNDTLLFISEFHH
jgi:hypothetical protein